MEYEAKRDGIISSLALRVVGLLFVGGAVAYIAERTHLASFEIIAICLLGFGALVVLLATVGGSDVQRAGRISILEKIIRSLFAAAAYLLMIIGIGIMLLFGICYMVVKGK